MKPIKLTAMVLTIVLASIQMFVLNVAVDVSAEIAVPSNSNTSTHYKVIGFYKSGTFEGIEFLNKMNKMSNGIASMAEIELVDVQQPESITLTEQYHIYDVPYVVIVSPEGIVTGGIRGIPEDNDVVRAFVSPPMAKIIGAIQNNKIVVVVVNGEKAADNGTTIQSLRTIEKIFRASIETLELDTDVPTDAVVANQMGIRTKNNTRSTSVTVLSAGGIIDRFEAPVTTKDLLGSFQKVLLSKSGCGGAEEGGLKSLCDH